LAPTLSPGQVVVLDGLSAHKGQRVREIVEGPGCELVYLPPYSPDLNRIEQAFSKVKGLLRKAEARSRGSLIEAMEERSWRSRPWTHGVLRPLRLPRGGPTAVTNALVVVC
jgi:transposase